MAKAETEMLVVRQLVWVRGVAHEAGSRFRVVDAPEADDEVDAGTAAGWRREGWVEEVPHA